MKCRSSQTALISGVLMLGWSVVPGRELGRATCSSVAAHGKITAKQMLNTILEKWGIPVNLETDLSTNRAGSLLCPLLRLSHVALEVLSLKKSFYLDVCLCV